MLTDKELDDIRQKMLALEEEPPLDGWRKIKPEIQPGRWRRLIWWFGGGAMLLGGLGGLYYLEQLPDRQLEAHTRTDQRVVQVQTPAASPLPESVAEVQPAEAPATEPGDIQQQENRLSAGRVEDPAAAGASTEEDQANPMVERGVTAPSSTPEQALAAEGANGSEQKEAPDRRRQVEMHEEASLLGPVAAGAQPVQASKDQSQQAEAKAPTADQGVVVGPATATPSITAAASEKAGAEMETTKNGDEALAANRLSGAEGEKRERLPALAEPAPAKAVVQQAAPETEQAQVVEAKDAAATGNKEAKTAVSPEGLRIERAAMANGQQEQSKPLEETAAPVAEALATPRTLAFPMLYSKPAQWALAEGVVKLPLLPLLPEDRGAAEESVVPDPEKHKKEWTLGVHFSPRYAYRSFTPIGEDEILITGINKNNQSGRDRLGYDIGTSFSKSISPRLQWDASLSYLKLRENISYTYTDGTVDTLLRSVNSQGQLEVKPVFVNGQRQLISSYGYGSVHVGATYFFWQNSYRRLNLTAGAGANLLLRGRTEVYNGGEWVETLSFPAANKLLEQSNYDVFIGLGYNRALYRNYELTLMPTLHYYLGSTLQEREPFGIRSYTVGVKVQLRRRFHYQPPVGY